MEILSSPINKIAYAALDALQLQQIMLAKNIASANVSNYKPSYLNFEKALEIAESGSNDFSSAIITKNNNIQLDLELVQMQETVMHYKTILEVLSRKNALMKTVLGRN